MPDLSGAVADGALGRALPNHCFRERRDWHARCSCYQSKHGPVLVGLGRNDSEVHGHL